MIVAAFISDRGDKYLPNCQRTFWSMVPLGSVKYWWPFEDPDHVHGMAGNARRAWKWAYNIGAKFLFHVEEDFVFHQPIPIGDMRRTLEQNPQLAQVVLKRQPWSTEEHEAGGQIETNPGAYTQRDGFVEHSTLFSLNPSLIPRRTLALDWSPFHSGGVERAITEACHAAGMSFAYHGTIEDPPLCEHVGYERAAGWRW